VSKRSNVPAIDVRVGFRVAGDSDLFDLKEYEDIRIVSRRTFLTVLMA
jgi:hypothetical protein